MSRYLDPKSDIVFKKIFGDHPHLLKSFLNSVLPLPSDGLIESLEYLPVEQVPAIPALKNTVVDVKCVDQKGRIFIVEMQIQWTDSFMQSMLFGASKAYVKQLEKGEKYDYLLPVYGLGLLASTFDQETDDWYHHYKMVNVQKPERELKGLQLIFIELPKFKPNNFTERKLQVLWLRFLSEVNEKSRTIDPALFAIPEIQEAINLSEEAAYSPGELEAYDKYWDIISTEKTLISGYFNKGKETAKLNIAANLLNIGISMEQVAEIAQIPLEKFKKTPNETIIAWRCRRGMLELDEILIPFFELKYQALSAEEQQNFVGLLECSDPDMCDWFFGFALPLDKGLLNIVQHIRTFISDRVKR